MQELEQFKFSEYPSEELTIGLKYIILLKFKESGVIDQNMLNLIPPSEQANIYQLTKQHVEYTELQNILNKIIELKNTEHPSRARANLIESLKVKKDSLLLHDLIKFNVLHAEECYDSLHLDYFDIIQGYETKILEKDFIFAKYEPNLIELNDILALFRYKSVKPKAIICGNVMKLLAYFELNSFDLNLLEEYVQFSSNMPISGLNDLLVLNLKYDIPQKCIDYILNQIFQTLKPPYSISKILLSYDDTQKEFSDLKHFIENISTQYKTFDFVNETIYESLWFDIESEILDGIHFNPIPADSIESLCELLDTLSSTAPHGVDLKIIYDTQSLLNISLLDIPNRSWSLSSDRVKSLVKNIFQPSVHRQKVLQQL
eukprot:NODE_2_length_91304_cov_0.692462.p25 type:complete len:373 gc:universal NODE_2_length_91304_cov_0.692462:56713-57831(+)